MGLLLNSFFRINQARTIFGAAQFTDNPSPICRHLSTIGQAFLSGYHAVLKSPSVHNINAIVDNLVPSSLKGFAYEGASMGFTLLDSLMPWRASRLQEFYRGVGNPYAYLVLVGSGWILARKPGSVTKFARNLDPLLGWLSLDGYGFHEGFFNAGRYLHNQAHPKRLNGYAKNAFDQGFGRSLWFLEAGNVSRIAASISRFSETRKMDLWSGVGLASVYAGEVNEECLKQLSAAAGTYWPQLAQGAAFAAKARQRGNNVTEYTDQACRIVCGISSLEAANVTDSMLENLPSDEVEPTYEIWRRRVQKYFSR